MKSSNCPNCGAPLRPWSRRCEYCGSWFIPEKDEDFSEPVPVTYETENKYKIIISRTEPKSAEHGDIWIMPELPGNRGDGDPRIVTMRDENNMVKRNMKAGITILVLALCAAGLLALAAYLDANVTPQEKAAQTQEIAEQYAANTKTYPVLSVREYTQSETNRYGGVEDVETFYSVNYVDADGNVQTDDTFQNLPYGGMKLTRGDSDLYIVYPDHTEVLQLTNTTFAKLS